MDEQTLNSFRYVVGAPRPIRLAVRGPSGGPPDEVVIEAPYGVIGRGTGSHICLEGADIGYRHAYLQVIGGRVLCVDLLSRRGLEWDGATPGPWLSPEHRLRIGSYTLQLYDDGWSFDSELPSPLEFRPRSEQRPEYGVLPEVQLELAGGGGKAWPINRILTLIGRDERCRITCADEQISKVHCSLLLAPSGLWVIDLLGRTGVRVNGQQVACSYLPHGTEFQIGKYKLRAVYPQVAQQQQHPVEAGPLTQDDRHSAAKFLTRHHQVFPIEFEGDVLVVTPRGDIREFYYQDIHLESNQIVRLLQQHRFSSVVVDFQQVSIVGSIVLDSVATFCRNARGGATMCRAAPELLSVLETMKFHSIWPHFATRAEAIRALQAAGNPPASDARPQ
jgi:hypothetical protein